jgi:hypothetical protein
MNGGRKNQSITNFENFPILKKQQQQKRNENEFRIRIVPEIRHIHGRHRIGIERGVSTRGIAHKAVVNIVTRVHQNA